MEDARYQDGPGFNPIKHLMAPVFPAAQAGPDMIAGAAQLRVIRELLATRFKASEIADGLIVAPCMQGVGADVRQVGLLLGGTTGMLPPDSAERTMANNSESDRDWTEEIGSIERFASGHSPLDIKSH